MAIFETKAIVRQNGQLGSEVANVQYEPETTLTDIGLKKT